MLFGDARRLAPALIHALPRGQLAIGLGAAFALIWLLPPPQRRPRSDPRVAGRRSGAEPRSRDDPRRARRRNGECDTPDAAGSPRPDARSRAARRRWRVERPRMDRRPRTRTHRRRDVAADRSSSSRSRSRRRSRTAPTSPARRSRSRFSPHTRQAEVDCRARPRQRPRVGRLGCTFRRRSARVPDGHSRPRTQANAIPPIPSSLEKV
jgi:hypothetical protein